MREAALDLCPLVRGNDSWNEVVGEDALGAFFAAVYGKGDAFLKKGEVGGLLAAAKLFRIEADERSLYGLVVRARDIVRAEHLVVGFSVLLVGEWR